MCGIHLTIEQLLLSSSSSSNGVSETNAEHDWLRRRGPDHIGHHTSIIRQYKNNDNMTTNGIDSQYKINLLASVLNMRDTLVQQPYCIDHHHHHEYQYKYNSTVNEIGAEPAATTTSTSLATKSYLAWNGEVYQRLVPNDTSLDVNLGTVCRDSEHQQQQYEQQSTSSTDDESIQSLSLQDVWDTTVSDTELVARMIQESVFDYVHNDNDNNIDNRPRANFNTNSTTERDLINSYYCKRIAYVLSLLINTEYAFCLLTPTAVYFGRDPVGKRSLLVGTSVDNDNNNKIIRQWEVSSVAASTPLPTLDDNNTCINTGSTTWTEVQPGYVFCYDWSSATTTSCQLHSTQQLLQKIIIPQQSPPPTIITSIDEASYQLESLLLQAIRYRLGGLTKNDTIVSILFSGGLDSTVLAGLVLKLIPTTTILKLINVCFVDDDDDNNTTEIGNEHQNDKIGTNRVGDKKLNTSNNSPIAADTLAAQASYLELTDLYPSHTIQFVQYKANWSKIQQSESTVRHLMYPKNTLMDTNISLALWLAASQVNSTTTNNNSSKDIVDAAITTTTTTPVDDTQTTTPTCRILFTGLGADELMGGYGRHRKAWERGYNLPTGKQQIDDISNNNKSSDNIITRQRQQQLLLVQDNDTIRDVDRWDAVRAELDLDINRLYERNLGRDDRILSDHSVEVRLPFLDVHVIHFLRYICPLQYIVNYTCTTNDGLLGDKQILRILAHRLQLYTASTATKRAIQFGSRIAHVSDKKRFGSRRKATGDKKCTY